MKQNVSGKQLIPLLRTAINTLAENPIILFPLCISVFFQLLALEILYFSVRFPLSVFFGPIIKRLWGETYLHYPFNFVLLPKLFYYAQVAIFIFLGGFLCAMAVALIASINSEKKATVKSAFKETLPRYIHIFVASVLSFSLFSVLSIPYQMLAKRILISKSEKAILPYLKATITHGDPYFMLLIGVIASALLAFLIPVIVVEKKKIIAALIHNFKTLYRSFWFIVAVILVPTLLYVPVLLLRNSVSATADMALPGIPLLVVILSVFVTLAIDAAVLTATTIYYLSKREHK